MYHAQRALVALIVVAGVAAHASHARADAISDEKKVFQKLGAKLDNKANKCTLFKQADAERALHGPVVYVPSELSASICSWALTKDSSTGLTVNREGPPLYPPHDGTTGVSQVHHVTGVGQDAYTYYANLGAGGIYTADVLTSKGVTSVTLSERAGNAATALAIARTTMNR